MKRTPFITALIAVVGILLSTFAVLAGGTASVSGLAGQWDGNSRFTGISYEEATQKKVAAQNVETVLHISADGNVTGTIGGAELSNCVVKANRGWLGRLLHVKTDYIIRGKIVGAVVTGSDSGTHPINAPFNFDGTRINGSVFVIYPIKYPYPFLSLHLTR